MHLKKSLLLFPTFSVFAVAQNGTSSGAAATSSYLAAFPPCAVCVAPTLHLPTFKEAMELIDLDAVHPICCSRQRMRSP